MRNASNDEKCIIRETIESQKQRLEILQTSQVSKATASLKHGKAELWRQLCKSRKFSHPRASNMGIVTHRISWNDYCENQNNTINIINLVANARETKIPLRNKDL